ncbi:HlyD family efflux transporter periplasmic adaptor subunit [Pseudoalteromonas sp. A22]|uniref:efflux RND transporter periplasmic adaptor subunit n=1 Tax=Pseudoalteromonas sp. A22 TaxID=327511 RepID=UPI001BA74F13|nr:HlyD family efflux transporter periplasmic adaptor subunit [Pseudoalteromonas sp. A22]QUI61468.1 HlyD family efflux transporter periplasmic adaptor subunit [Pseudoalteromonas sp. A22]
MNIESGIRDTSAQDEVIVTKKSRGPIVKWAIVIIICLVVAFSVWGRVYSILSGEKGISVDQLSFIEVGKGDFIRQVTVQGVVVAANSPTIYSGSPGIVRYSVKAGDAVSKGQVLATIESPELNNLVNQERTRLSELELAVERQELELKSALSDAQKEIDLAKVNLVLAEKQKERAEKSFEAQIISKEALEVTVAEREVALLNHKHSIIEYGNVKDEEKFELDTRNFELQRQKLILEDAERQLTELVSHSPINGVVGVTSFKDFDQVEDHQPLLTVIELDNYEVEVYIPEIYADEMTHMMESKVFVNGEYKNAQLVGISPEVVDGQVKGRLRFADNSIGLRQNQRVSAQIFIESKRDVLKLKSGAYLDSSGGKYVYVVKDQHAVKREVNFGMRNAGEVEVISGLKEGEVVIASNVELFAQAKQIYLYK